MSKMLPYLLGLVAAGTAGALVAITLGTGEPPESGDRGDVSRLRAEVTDLRADMRALEDRLRDSGIATVTEAGREAPAVLPPPGSDDGAAADSPAAMEAAAPGRTTPEAIEETVKTAVANEQKKRQEAIGKRFQAMAIEREKSQLDRLTEDHGLTAFQRDEMEKILARRREAIGEMFRTMFSGETEGAPDFTTIRKKMSDVRVESDDQLKVLLSPDQYEAFQAEDQSARMGPPWMSGRSGGRSGENGAGSGGGSGR